MQVSNFFTLDELTFSEIGIRRGLKNEPGEKEIEALRSLCLHLLDPLRIALGRAVVINSAFRSEAVNRVVGGAKDSQHLRGEAADLVVPGMSAKAVADFIRRSRLPFDQLIFEGTWTHVSYSRVRNRGQVLRAVFARTGTKYVPL